MKKIFPLIGMLCLTWVYGSAQTHLSIKMYAGSNASWGTGQYVSIDPKGNVIYTLSEVNKGVKDSLSFTLTTAQMKQLEETVNRIRFFQLNATYNAQSRDGTRLSVEVTAAGNTHTVHWVNIHTSESALLLDSLNVVLRSKGISIHY
jgi:Domain of unknown function (DUF6438)